MRTTFRRLTLAIAMTAVSVFGQSKPAFEVATVKPAAPLDQARTIAALQSGKMPYGANIGNGRAEYKYLDLKTC